MANTKSAVKRARQSQERNLRNRRYKSGIRTAVRKFEAALGNEGAEEAMRDAVRQLDRAASKGVIHPNAARRKKSRLARDLHRQASDES